MPLGSIVKAGYADLPRRRMIDLLVQREHLLLQTLATLLEEQSASVVDAAIRSGKLDASQRDAMIATMRHFGIREPMSATVIIETIHRHLTQTSA